MEQLDLTELSNILKKCKTSLTIFKLSQKFENELIKNNFNLDEHFDEVFNFNQKTIIKMIVKRLNGYDNQGCTVFYYACAAGYIHVIELLLKLKNDYSMKSHFINKQNDFGNTPIYVACANNRIDIVKILLNDLDINYNIANLEGNTPLHIACSNGHYDIVKLLLDINIDINRKNKLNYTPFHLACINQKTNINLVKLFFARDDCDYNTVDYNHNTPLHSVCSDYKKYKVLKLFLKYIDKIDLNKINLFGSTAFYIACENRNHQLVKLFLSKLRYHSDFKCIYTPKNDMTPFRIVCCFHGLEVLKIFLKNTSWIKNRINTTSKRTNLFLINYLISQNNIYITEYLLKNRYINFYYNNTALKYSVNNISSLLKYNYLIINFGPINNVFKYQTQIYNEYT